MDSNDDTLSSKMQSFKKQYDEIYPLARRLAEELADQLTFLAETNRISLGFPVQFRAKKWSSIQDKLTRLDLDLDSIVDLQDLVGLRAILLFRKDVLALADLLESSFDVIRQYDTLDRLDEDQFGYSSLHLVVGIPDEWLSVPTFAPMKNFQAEIQIRTLPQHMWAEASQLLQYKQEAAVPKGILRSIYRVSALLESVDLEYDRILEQREEYRHSAIPKEDDEQLNVDLIEKILDASLPNEHKDEIEPYSQLLTDLHRCSISTTSELQELIEEMLHPALERDEELVKERKKEFESKRIIIGTTPERLQSGVFFTHVGLVRSMLRQKFGYDLREGGTYSFEENA